MENIAFVPLTEQYIEIVREWRNSESISKYMYTNDIITAEQQSQWYQKVSKDESQKNYIITKNNEPVGFVSIHSIKPKFKTCYWGYYIGKETSSGTGLGAKIEYKLLNFVFDELKMNKLLCEVIDFNSMVIKLHEKFGFRREGYFRQHICKNGQFHDVISLAILKSEWLSIKESFTKILNR